MKDTYDKLLDKYNKINEFINETSVDYNSKVYKDNLKELNQLSSTLKLFNEFNEIEKQIEEARELIKNTIEKDIRELAEEELRELDKKYSSFEREIKLSLLPKDPNSGKNIIMEIRAGTGGEEAALFVSDLFRMYSRYSEIKNLKLEVLSSNPTGIGGLKEIIFSIEGKDAYDSLKYEMGGHRVQRIPVTEASGRIHTSAVTIAVLPEAEEYEIEIDPKDLRIDVYRSSGHGGQSVNTTDSAVRVTHIPTGIVATCQDEKSQHKNKAKALKVVYARLKDKYDTEKKSKIDNERKSQVGSGDRSQRIRTYNFPQNRITDHRVNLTLYKLDKVLDGELDEMITTLKEDEKDNLLKTAIE